ncbi:uncharacterized protein [Primulina huaijiensis]|uniref:uncharacterized protein n=1 Tax=Primulina huaijiensis TaxID=1492673 RepID=UPI003CC79893
MPPRRAPSTDRHDGIPGEQAPRPQVEIYEQFRRLNPKDLGGTTDPFVAEGWIRSLELHFQYLDMRDVDRVRCATYMLRDDASLWWEGAAHGGESSIAELIRKFDRGCNFVPIIARDDTDKLRHLMDGLRPTIRRDVMLMRLASYDAATACSLQVEQAWRNIDIEM